MLRSWNDTARAALSALGALSLLIAGCGSSSHGHDAAAHDGDFSVCAGSDAGPYQPGTVEVSRAGAYKVTLVSAITEGTPPVDGPGVGFDTFTFSVTDTAGAVPAGLGMTAQKPYMPEHMHSATTFPTVMDAGGGTFIVSGINFFMSGYWELTLDLQPPAAGADASAAIDPVVFSLCVPS